MTTSFPHRARVATTPMPSEPPEPFRDPEPDPDPAPSPSPAPWHNPGPPVRRVDLPPDTPSPGIPIESPERRGSLAGR